MTPYLEVDDAQDYFDDRLNTLVWEEATDSDKLKALKTATRLINNLRFIGKKLIADQENEFPRIGQISIPDAIKAATCELALVLLDSVDPNFEIENTPVTGDSFALAKSTFNRDFVMAHVRNGIPSSEAWAKLLPYLVDPLAMRLKR